MGAGLTAAVWAVRRLGLPAWWLCFPPLFEAVIVGNPDALILALLLARGPIAGLAAGLKVYALIPLVLARRWTAVAVALLVALASLPLLPAFLASLGSVSGVLERGTAHLSAWGTWLVVPTVLALVMLRRRGAEWLVVPALWPATQRHYAAMSLPAVRRSPIGAALMSLSLPLAPAVAVIAMAVEAWWRDRRDRLRSGRSDEDDPLVVRVDRPPAGRGLEAGDEATLLGRGRDDDADPPAVEDG